ncbi:MAG: radical SAM protein [Pseudomonadota bacterium]
MLCTICERGCRLPDGSTGACGMYRNVGGIVEEVHPDRYLMVCPISVETMPMLHFHPASKFLQISTIGCNFDCPGCISTVVVKEIDPSCQAVRRISPETIVGEAEKHECKGIAFLMNDPLATLHTFVRVARRAKERGLMAGCASNAYFTEGALDSLIPFLDFIHVGFKGGSDDAYAECGALSMSPVLRNTRILKERGVHVEVSCVHKRGKDGEVEHVARQIRGISREIPFHVMRFVPLEQTSRDEEPSIRESEDLCSRLRNSLSYVYLFNSPGTEFLSTICPSCGEVVIKREFYGPMGAKLKLNATAPGSPVSCHLCWTPIGIRGEFGKLPFREQMFEGGYPFTRALEILEAMLITLGVTHGRDLVRALDGILGSGLFHSLHEAIQAPGSYLDFVAELGGLVGRSQEAETLIGYLEERLDIIERGVRRARTRPSVYYAMGKPWFCINANRMENNLVELAGGRSLNRSIEGTGRPGTEITPDRLNRLDPEIIFISAFFTSSPEDFYAECARKGIQVRATRNLRVHCHPIPVSDFGSPRWILGLMHIANTIQPEHFAFDVTAEASMFYRRFYHAECSLEQVNLSFGKPFSSWAFE